MERRKIHCERPIFGTPLRNNIRKSCSRNEHRTKHDDFFYREVLRLFLEQPKTINIITYVVSWRFINFKTFINFIYFQLTPLYNKVSFVTQKYYNTIL